MQKSPHTTHFRPSVTCPGPAVDRRAFLLGGLAAAITSSLVNWQLHAAESIRHPKQCVLLWMNGGPSHIDTFDPKPGTKDGGPFKAIKTSIAGLQVSEHLPQLAEQAKHLAVIRSMTTKEGNHDRGQYLMHTGYAPSATLKHPSIGSWVSHELGNRDAELPQFVSVRGPSISAGFLGVEHSPFCVQKPTEGVRNLPLPKDVDAQRFALRLEALDFLQTQFNRQSQQPGVLAQNSVTQKAVRLMRSPLTKAFDIGSEPMAVQKAYGDSEFGRGCLLARRLIEADVPFVEVMLDGWDTHYDNFTSVKNLSRDLDPAFASLVKELAARDRLQDTLVIWMGEFGRTPKISTNDGRDHYPQAWSAVLAGGGVRAGQVYGATDESGAKVTSNPVTVNDYFATLATLMGIDPKHEEMSPVGRPIAISDNGKPIAKLLS